MHQAALILLLPLLTQADDWPQFLGPERNGVSSASAISKDWSKSEPKPLWKKKVGQGFAGPVVHSGKVILFHRLDNDEVVTCFNAENGQELWAAKYPTRYQDDFGFDEGPRATPAIINGRVYTLGAEGMVQCLDFAEGKQIWTVDCKKQFRSGKGFFGMACSPLVEGDNVLLNIGGENGAGIVALDKSNGKLRWKATNHEASYSSPTVAELDGKRRALFFTRNGLVVLDPRNGEVLVDYPWRARMSASVNAATPLVVNNQIFISASYGVGALLLDWNHGQARKVWANDDVLSNHYSTSVYHNGFLYGFDGRQESGQTLACVEWQTGKSRWRKDGLGAGTVTLVNSDLLVLKEDGELLLVSATPEKYNQLASTQILGSTARPYPALDNGRIYARDKTQLVAVTFR